MLGRHHLMLSTVTVLTILTPLIHYPSLVLTVLVGTVIGSLIPDVDGEDATIFHEKVKGLQGSSRLINFTLAPVFPVFGYTTKYLIYFPSVLVYDKILLKNYRLQRQHRGFLHSLLGVGTSTALTGAYLTALLMVLGFFNPFYTVVFLAGYLLGGTLHLVQDSCTKTGVKWLQPFSNIKLKGKLVTSTKPEHIKKPHLLVLTLSVTGLFVLVARLLTQDTATLLKTSIGLTAVLWILFLFFVAKVRKI